jgi:hypothetical protein
VGSGQDNTENSLQRTKKQYRRTMEKVYRLDHKEWKQTKDEVIQAQTWSAARLSPSRGPVNIQYKSASVGLGKKTLMKAARPWKNSKEGWPEWEKGGHG